MIKLRKPSAPRFIINLLIFFLSISAIDSALAQPADAWETIFNGKNLNGWSIIGSTGKVSISDGSIELHQRANTKEHTFVRSDKRYQNFIMEVDCKRDPLFFYGILFRAQPAPDTAHVRLYGYQIKFDHKPDRRWTGGIFDDFGNTWNWLYTLTEDKRAQNATKPAGEWDHYRIEAFDDHIKVWVNGVPTTNMINNKYEEGYIAFKIHFLGNKVEREKEGGWIKNIRVITKDPEQYSQAMDIPIKNVE